MRGGIPGNDLSGNVPKKGKTVTLSQSRPQALYSFKYWQRKQCLASRYNILLSTKGGDALNVPSCAGESMKEVSKQQPPVPVLIDRIV